MKQLTITIENESQLTSILEVLTEAEENGEIDFPFNCQVDEIED